MLYIKYSTIRGKLQCHIWKTVDIKILVKNNKRDMSICICSASEFNNYKYDLKHISSSLCIKTSIKNILKNCIKVIKLQAVSDKKYNTISKLYI